jgi:ubiquinone/menaquinone biosynthesis C-methylase UbiE
MAETPIEVAALIAAADAAEHARRADASHAGTDAAHWSFRKPFAPLDKAGPNLTRLGAMLEAADLSPGVRVLDFGCGVAWLGRLLAEAGCEVVAADVSATALAAAAEHDARFRPGGRRIAYLRTDGVALDLPDASLDRVLCHEALHHVPDMSAVIAEFRRVLRPGGRAVFMEPGPEHSRALSSQDEMRRYGTIENDIHVERIWEVARAAGFADIRVGLFTVRPEMLALDRFMALWAHERRGAPAPVPAPGETYRRLAMPVLGGFRMFALFVDPVPETEMPDSRIGDGLAAGIEVLRAARVVGGLALEIAIVNTGSRAWLPSGGGKGAVNLGALLLDASGALKDRNWRRHRCIGGTLPPGGRIVTNWTVPLPEGARLSLDMVAEHVRWFGQPGLGVVVGG